jgi:protein involved in polysaccharide export with SLBB domain
MVSLVFSFALLPYSGAQAQQTPSQQNAITMQNLSTVKVDQLTDDQIIRFWREARSKGLTKAQLEAMARERNMPEQELQKLMTRIDKIEEKALESNKSQGKEKNDKKEEGDKSKTPLNKEEQEIEEQAKRDKELEAAFAMLSPKVFGAEVFQNKNITFEPSLNIPTPANYVLGAGDELSVDIYGYSEASYEVIVSSDGNLRIPGIGLVKVGGTTIEQAKAKITSKLRQVYSTIASGQTKVNVSVTSIRSIKVTIMGEVSVPGTYMLPSLATVLNALHSCGGPNENGSLRNISIIRGGKTIATVDVYDYLIKGKSTAHVTLQDQDIIKINAYQNRVEMKGQVKRPALYEVSGKETLKDVIEFAGGFTNKAYAAKIKVQRNTATQISVADVSEELYSMFLPLNGDVYMVGELLTRFENRVIIEGAVFRPGEYAMESGLTVKRLIEKCDGLTEDAFLSRAIIYRLKDDNSLEVLSFDAGKLMKNEIADIVLKREDKVIIASKLEMREEYKIRIEGEVMVPGEYEFGENMKLEDLIIAAGGMKESASYKRIQVGRRVDTADRTSAITNISQVFSVDIEKDLKDNPSAASFVLRPFDIVTVYQNPGYIKQSTVKLYGQVMFPGEFVILKNKERISDIIKRSGGLTNEAFPEGAILVRYRLNNLNEQLINANKLRALKKVVDTEDAKELTKEEEFKRNFDLVAIDLAKIMKNPGGKEDVIVTDRDVINIPKIQQTVLVSGEVLFPVKTVYEKGLSFRECISNSGGYTTQAITRKAYVVYANGSAKSTKNFLFIHFRPKIKPGCEIIVPPKEKKDSLSTVETVSIITSMTTLLVIITSTFLK